MDDLSNNKGNPSFTSVRLGNNGVPCKASWSWLEKILNFFFIIILIILATETKKACSVVL